MSLLPVERVDADVVIVGSGFSGSLAALALRRLGRRVVLVERGRHPRFAIGESSTPLANLLLEEFADRYHLPRIRSFSKWGTWRRERPDVACGLKRGFTFYFHNTGDADNAVPGSESSRPRELLVAASPHDEIADTHWYRPDFDHALVREAEAEGVIYLDDTQLAGLCERGDLVVLDGTRRGRSIRVSAGFVIDATGPRGFLPQTLRLPARPLRWMPPTQGLYTHLDDVPPWQAVSPAQPQPPYPPDAAAVHHVFPGGWIWVLRFANGITSAGAAVVDPLANELRAADGSQAWERLLAHLPSVRRQFAGSRARFPFVHVPRLAFRSAEVAGSRWAMLPSAAGFIDPLLSTGFPLTLLGMQRLLDVLERTPSGSSRDEALGAYARVTQDELDVTEQLVAALYASMGRPVLFARLSLLYFAAASYSETARRLGKPALAPGFLLHAHPRFGPELRACAALASQAPEGRALERLLDRIDRAIEPFDVAGLVDRKHGDWFPVRASDLLANASKVEASVEEVEALLERCGFAAPTR